MTEKTLRQCYLCEDWFPLNSVEEVCFERHPNSIPSTEYVCERCLKTSKTERLLEKVAKAMESGAFNEIEMTDGDLKVHLIRYSPAPLMAPPVIPGWQQYKGW